MANAVSKINPINIPPGVTPITDDTSLFAQNYVSSTGIRFRKGRPEKVGGFKSFPFQSGQAILGVPRSEYSTEINGTFYTLIGTDKRLYALIGSTLTNITPFSTVLSEASNTLSTLYTTLATDPFTTTIGSNIVTVADTSASRFQVGDQVTFSGSDDVGGILLATLNAVQTIHTIGVNSYTFISATTATSSEVGGDNAVVRACGLMRCTVANTLVEGDRVKMITASDTGGILAASINAEFIVRNVTASVFDFMTAGVATSSVAGGGGALDFYPPIAAGNADEAFGTGYGVGLYGVGLYGVAKTSTSLHLYPQIWYFDRFGDYVMMTPGNGGALYEWTGDVTIAPVITLNSPTAINYMFVADNTVITFGNGGTENRITACDQGNRTVWSGTAQNQFFDAVQSGAARFISAIKLNGAHLIFTEKQVYTFRQIGLPNVWECKLLTNIGMISSMAGFEIGGIAYWMGLANFYTWDGGSVAVMPSNVADVCSCLNYVFNNINTAQKSKTFCWFNKQFQEWRIHYPSAASNEPDRVVCNNLLEKTWWPDTISRTCAERPATLLTYPRLLDSSGNMYQHENGTDADVSALSFSLVTNTRTLGKNETLLSAFIPDSIQTTGNLTVTLNMFQWPNSLVSISNQPYTVAVGDGRENIAQVGRFWQYTIAGNALGQWWRMGNWTEEVQLAGNGP